MFHPRRTAFALACVSLWVYAAAVARAETYDVRSPADLAAVLDQAAGGDVVRLAGGAYGAMSMRNRYFEPALSIIAEDSNARPTFTSIRIDQVAGLHLENLDVRYGATAAPLTDFAVTVTGGGDLELTGMWIEGAADSDPANDPKGFIARDCDGVTVRGSTFTDLYNGAAIFDCSNAAIVDSIFTRLTVDGVTGRGLVRGHIEGNLFIDFASDLSTGAHPDAIQLWNDHATRENRDIVIARNVILRGDGGPAQGIFIKGKDANLPSRNILIEHNVVQQSMAQGIFLENVDGAVVRYNTVAPVDALQDHPGIETRAPFANVRIEHNLFTSLRVDNPSIGVGNRLLDYENPWSVDYADHHLMNPRAGADATPADFRAIGLAGASDIPLSIGPFGAPLFDIVATRSDADDLAGHYFFLSGPPQLKRAEWTVSDGEAEIDHARTAAIEHRFAHAGHAFVEASAKIGNLEAGARRILRVHPRTLAQLEFNGGLEDAAPEPAPKSGAVAAIAPTHVSFDGTPAADGQHLKFAGAPHWTGMPRLDISLRIRRAGAGTDWQYLVAAPGAYQVKMNGDRLYAAFTNEEGETTALNIAAAGISDGSWRDLVIRYDGRAGRIEARDGERLIAATTAPVGLLAYRPTGPLYLGGAPWGNSIAADIDRFVLTR